MPTLKQIHCSIELSSSNTPLKEHGIRYRDGMVECFILVPDTHVPFAVHVQSEGYIAPGLAAFVFMDGQYQCNRNRVNLSLPADGMDPSRYQVDFRLRQKEEKTAKGTFVGREWTFGHLNISNADNSEDPNPIFLQNVGTVEVVVLRCKSEGEFVATPRAPYSIPPPREENPTKQSKKIPAVKNPSLEVGSIKLAGAVAPDGKVASVRPASQQGQSAKLASVAASDGGMLSGLFGMDGTNDEPYRFAPVNCANNGPPSHEMPLYSIGQVAPLASPGQEWNGIHGGFVPIPMASGPSRASPAQHSELWTNPCHFRDDRTSTHAGGKPEGGFMNASTQHPPLKNTGVQPDGIKQQLAVTMNPLHCGGVRETADTTPGHQARRIPVDADQPKPFGQSHAAPHESIRQAHLQFPGRAHQILPGYIPVSRQEDRAVPQSKEGMVKKVQEQIQATGAKIEAMIAQLRQTMAEMVQHLQDMDLRANSLPAGSQERAQLLLNMDKLYEERLGLKKTTTQLQLELDRLVVIGYQTRDNSTRVEKQQQPTSNARPLGTPHVNNSPVPQIVTSRVQQNEWNTGEPAHAVEANLDPGFKQIGEGVIRGGGDTLKQDLRTQNQHDDPQHNEPVPGYGYGNTAMNNVERDDRLGIERPAQTYGKPASQRREHGTSWQDTGLKPGDCCWSWDQRSEQAPQHSELNDCCKSSKQEFPNGGNNGRIGRCHHSSTKEQSVCRRNEPEQVTEAWKQDSDWGQNWSGDIQAANNCNTWDKALSDKNTKISYGSSIGDETFLSGLNIKPYWTDWSKISNPRTSKNRVDNKPRHTPRSVYEYPISALPTVTEGKLSDSISFGVQPGEGASYVHRCHRPEYLDTMQKPYAVFSFKYRSVAALEKILDRKLDDEVKQFEETVERQKLERMPRKKLVEELVRMKVPLQQAEAKSDLKPDCGWDALAGANQASNAWGGGWGEENNQNNGGNLGNGDGRLKNSKSSAHGGKSQIGSTFSKRRSRQDHQNQKAGCYGGSARAVGWDTSPEAQPNNTAWGNAPCSQSNKGQGSGQGGSWDNNPAGNRHNANTGMWNKAPSNTGAWDGDCNGHVKGRTPSTGRREASINSDRMAGLSNINPALTRNGLATPTFIPGFDAQQHAQLAVAGATQQFETESERQFMTGEWCAREQPLETTTLHPVKQVALLTTPKPPQSSSQSHHRVSQRDIDQASAPVGQPLSRAGPTKPASICNGPGDMHTATGFEREDEDSTAAHPFNGDENFVRTGDAERRAGIQW